MKQYRNARNGDVQTVPDALVEKYEASEDWSPLGDNFDGVLRGQALDDALDAAGLPKTGSADEKRARLAEHDANGDG